MFNFGLSRTPKPSENRRKVGADETWWDRQVQSLRHRCVIIALAFWVAAALILIVGDEPVPYSIGKVLKQPVLSRVTFERIDELATEKARTDAQHAVPNFYRVNQTLVEAVLTEFREMRSAVKATENLDKFLEQHAARWPIDAATYDALIQAVDTASGDPFKQSLDRFPKVLLEENLIERDTVERGVRSSANHVMLADGAGQYRNVGMTKLTYATNPEQVEALADRVASRVFITDRRVRGIFRLILARAIAPGENRYQPVYAFDSAKTRTEIEAAGTIEPVKVTYSKDDRLVSPGRISEESFALLKIEHEEYLKQRSNDPALRVQWRNKRLGQIGVVLLITIGLSIFTKRTQPRIANRMPRAIGVALLLLTMLFIERYVILRVSDSPIWCVLPVSMTAAILAISYTQLFAFGAAGALALLTALMLGTPFGMLIAMISVVSVVVLMLKEIRTRMKMLEVGGLASAAAYASTFLVYLGDGEINFLGDPLYAAIATLAGLSMVQVLMPLIERAFKVTTSQTLLEWADTSRPLLRQLIEKAPGTWQHSHLLGSMAESAAEDIAANGLLVRVGAYYHDIGKLCKPNYFVENQEARMNAHQGLAPTMSLLVILAHVKDGLALAREHGLPSVLHQFIAEHHGTTLVKYFHHMATQEAKAAGRHGREVSESEFRYPGPKPRSREAAILMLCDGCEGAIRSLQDPTPSRIESVVHEITMARLMDGQFDDCEITLKELARVEQSLVRSLRAIHHGRISYPKSTSDSQAKTA